MSQKNLKCNSLLNFLFKDFSAEYTANFTEFLKSQHLDQNPHQDQDHN